MKNLKKIVVAGLVISVLALNSITVFAKGTEKTISESSKTKICRMAESIDPPIVH